MPHERLRHLQTPFDKLIRNARIIGILGHRQVGKTTFLQRVANEYVTLDDETSFARASESPKEFLRSLKANRSGIDECQLVPALFPALKVKIGTSSIPGRFILSGSVRFTSRRAIRESLTGRIANLELFPFVLTEIEGSLNSTFFPDIIQAQDLERFIEKHSAVSGAHALRTKAIHKYLNQGGFPGLFHLREETVRRSMIRNMIETILDRDLRLVYRTSLPYQRIFEYCANIAADPLKIVRVGSLRRKSRMAEVTQAHLLQALEAVFLLRRIRVEGDYKGDLFWLEDQCERSYFRSIEKPDYSDWVTLAYRNIRAQFGYQLGTNADFFLYRTRGGAEVPLAIRTPQGTIGIIIVKARSDIGRSLKRSADSFLKHYNHSRVLFLTQEAKHFDILNDRIAVAPIQTALY